MSSYKTQVVETTVPDALSDAFQEFQSLRDEMREGADNMEAGNMGHMEKCQRLAEAADTLDGFADNEPDVPDAATDLKVTTHISVQKRKGRGTSRAIRFDNAVALLSAAKEAVEEAMDQANDNAKTADLEAEGSQADADDARAEDPPDEDRALDCESEAYGHEQDADRYRSEAEELESFRDELESALGDAESGIEFPGMYG